MRSCPPRLPHPLRLASPSRLLRLLGLAAACWLAPAPAQAQIEPIAPGKVKAANRRALREDRTTDSPYKESHLAVSRGQLRRGQSNQPTPETRRELDYSGTAPNVQPAGFLGLRHKKNKLQRPPAPAGKNAPRTAKK